jgi:ribosomal protein S1
MKALLPKPERFGDTRRRSKGGGRRGGKGSSRTQKIEVGDVFEEAEVVKILSFGAFVRLTPETDGLLHISEIMHGRIDRVEDVLKLGDKVKVKVIRVERGKVNVSAKAMIPKASEM